MTDPLITLQQAAKAFLGDESKYWTLRELRLTYERTKGKEGLRTVKIGRAYLTSPTWWEEYLESIRIKPDNEPEEVATSPPISGAIIDPKLWGGKRKKPR
jgi:hypothetical protein